MKTRLDEAPVFGKRVDQVFFGICMVKIGPNHCNTEFKRCLLKHWVGDLSQD